MILIMHGYFKRQLHFLLHLVALGVCVKELVGYLRPKFWILACIIDIHFLLWVGVWLVGFSDGSGGCPLCWFNDIISVNDSTCLRLW